MNNHLTELLKHWHPLRDEHLWVLATVYKTVGPCYRRAGAMMLFNDLGQPFGLLSGGCLEADIQRHAARVMHSKRSLTVSYDGSDEDDITFQLGIGCGGTVHIVLQPILPKLHYLHLNEVHEQLNNGGKGLYYQLIAADGEIETRWETSQLSNDRSTQRSSPELIEKDNQTWLLTNLSPPPHLLVIGAGVDAQPVVQMAKTLGWTVTLWDSRPANGRREYFMSADQILRQPLNQLMEHKSAARWDAAVVMSHNLQIDADAIKALQGSAIGYLALLGPASRKQQVLALAHLDEQELCIPLAGPAGLNLGAELPEGIALSILAECHAVLQGAAGQSLSGVLATVAETP
jgi:xanthine dehydrogenase accessory factor